MGTGIRPLVGVALLLLGVACDDGATTAPATPEPVAGLVATIGTNRLFQPRRELGLGLRNVSDQAVEVDGFQLLSDGFDAVPPVARSVVLPPGRRLVIPLPYGEVRCDGAPDPYEAAVVLADGRRLELRAAEERPGAIDRVHERECAAAEIRELVDLRFEGAWERDGVSIAGELVVEQRRRGPTVAVEDVTGNVIFTVQLDTADTPVARVDDDAPLVTVPVTITADRCDSHAVAEFKRPMVFLTWIAVDGGEPTPVELEVTGAARQALEALLASC